MSVRLARISRLPWSVLATLLLSALATTALAPVSALTSVAAANYGTRQANLATTPVSPATTKPVVAKPDTKPYWSDLTETQKVALAPLAADWRGIDIFRKKKWLEIASRYPAMKPAEQQRLQQRMREWAKLSPDERRVAREIYTRTKTLGADEKSAQWLEYQQLPEAEKHRLSSDLAAKRRVANLPTAPMVSKPTVATKPSEIPVLAKPSPTKPVPMLPPATPTAVAPLPAEVVPVAPPVSVPAPQPIPMIN